MYSFDARLVWVCAGLLASGAALAAQPVVPDPVPLPSVLRQSDAVRLLRERGLDLLVAEANVRAVEGDVRSAGAIANPALGLSYGRSFTYGSCVDANGAPASCGTLPDAQYGVALSDQGAIVDGISGKRGLRVATARAALAAAQASRDDARRTLEAQVRQSFVQAVMAKEALRFAEEVAAASARTLDLTRARFDAGAISEADLARIEVAKLEADQARTTARQALRGAKVGLAFLLGVRGPVPEFEVDGSELLRASTAPGFPEARPDLLIGRARERRPDLVAARKQQDRAESSLALARRQRFPDIQLSLNYTQQGSTSSAITPPTLTAGISLPLPFLYQQQGEIQRAEAELDTQRLATARLEAQLVSEVESAWADLQGAAELTRRMEGGMLERSARARDLVEVQYRKGAASLLEYLDAQRTFIGTRVEYLNDLSAYWAAYHRLQQAIGEELR